MRLSDVIAIGKECLIWGTMAVAFIGIVVLIGYGLIYKKALKRKGTLRPGKFALYALFGLYMLVLFSVTTLRHRGAYMGGNTQFHLFYAYREAWNSFSGIHWRQIILNILMCVPLGFLLPLVFVRLRVWWKSCLTGAGVVLFIEMVQLVLRRGICDVDDIFNNTLGVMIGYGCYEIWNLLVCCVKKQKKNLLRMLVCQIPLIAAAAGFGIIFYIYANQELGNLKSDMIVRKKNITVTNEIKASGSEGVYTEEERTVPIYSGQKIDAARSREIAEEFFAALGEEIDESYTQIYDETAFYHSLNEKAISIDYINQKCDYTDFAKLFGESEEERKADATEKEVRDALRVLEVEIPEEAVFENQGEGNYSFTVDCLKKDGVMYDGVLHCTYTKKENIVEFRNAIAIYKPYKTFEIISGKEAFARLENGEFHWGNNTSLDITVKDVTLDYETDSKGYYQPVYRFGVEIEGEEYSINIPAMK